MPVSRIFAAFATSPGHLEHTKRGAGRTAPGSGHQVVDSRLLGAAVPARDAGSPVPRRQARAGLIRGSSAADGECGQSRRASGPPSNQPGSTPP